MISILSYRSFMAAMTLAALLGASACRHTGPDPMVRQAAQDFLDDGAPRPIAGAPAPGSFKEFTAWLHSADDV